MLNSYSKDNLGAQNVQYNGFIDWFCGQHFCYSKSTIRSYTASILLYLESAQGMGKFSADTADKLKKKLEYGPTPKDRGDEKRTSSKKLKTVNEKDVHRLIAVFRNSGNAEGLFYANWLVFSALFFPRPNEWHGAKNIKCETDDGVIFFLKLPNSKNSNGRTFGPYRHLELKLTGGAISELELFIREYKRRASEHKTERHYHDQLRGMIKRICVKHKIKPFSPYALRGLGMATAKRSMDSLAVSYAAGHRSDRTKIENYPRTKRKGSDWLKPEMAFRVSEDQCNLVRVTGRVRSKKDKTLTVRHQGF